MQFAAALSAADEPRKAAHDLVGPVELSLPGSPDFAVLFFTAHWLRECSALVEAVRAALRPGVTLAASAEGVLGCGTEIERAPGAALLAGSVPGIELKPFHVGVEEWEGLLADDERLQQRIGAGPDHQGQLLLPDPFTTPMDPLLERLDTVLARPSFGGMVSAAHSPGVNRLFVDERCWGEGMVGLGIGGALEIRTVVSQGCRPIGEPFVVTRAQGNLLQELGRRPALQAAQEMLSRLTGEEARLARTGLMLGVVINEYQDRFDRGDFLVRSLMGADPQSGALAVGEHVRAGQTVQFHARDAGTAHEDLARMLETARGEGGAAGGLLFSCNGRGTRMFPEPHHDAGAVEKSLPGLPLAGFFAMGEIGPVAGRGFVHGHTASLALFRPA